MKDKIHSGENFYLEFSDTNYPVSQWDSVLVLRGDNDVGNIDINADKQDNKFIFNVSYNITKNWGKGVYRYGLYVYNEDERYLIEEGNVEIKQSLIDIVGGVDTRSHVRKVFDALKEIIEGRVDKSYYSSISIGGRSIAYMSLEELTNNYLRYKNFVEQEEMADKLNKNNNGKKILIRF